MRRLQMLSERVLALKGEQADAAREEFFLLLIGLVTFLLVALAVVTSVELLFAVRALMLESDVVDVRLMRDF